MKTIRLKCRECGVDTGESMLSGVISYCPGCDPMRPEMQPVPLSPIRYRGANGEWYDDEGEARSKYSWSAR